VKGFEQVRRYEFSYAAQKRPFHFFYTDITLLIPIASQTQTPFQLIPACPESFFVLQDTAWH
jgi:hypothetical protein